MKCQLEAYQLTEFQKQMVYGCLWGDACLQPIPPVVNCHLSFYHSIKQSDYIQFKHKKLSPFSRPVKHDLHIDKRNGKCYEGFRFWTVSHNFFTSLYPFFYDSSGQKIVSDKIVEEANEIALAFLIGDDGSIRRNTISIATCSFHLKDVELLVCWLEKLGLKAWVRDAEYPRITISANSLPRLRRLILPYLPKSLLYKMGGISEPKLFNPIGKKTFVCEFCLRTFQDYESSRRKSKHVFCSQECRSKWQLFYPLKFWLGKKRPDWSSKLKELWRSGNWKRKYGISQR